MRDNIMARLQEASGNQPTGAPRETAAATTDGQDGRNASSNSSDNGTDDTKAGKGNKKAASGSKDKKGATAIRADGVEADGIGVAGADVPDDSGGGVGTQDEWVEETVEHPAPDYGLGSPVIR